jgi:hypothetical protein
MEKQVTEMDVVFIEAFEAYADDSKSMGEIKARMENARVLLEPVIKANKLPVGDNKAWKEKRALLYPIVKGLEGDTTETKKAEARIAAWLGVLRTCLEYQILPTDKNADRLRKAKVWTGLNGNGKVNPNWVDPKAPAPATTPRVETPNLAALSDAEAEKVVDKQIEAMEKAHEKQAGASLDKVANVLDLVTMTTPAASVKTATPQSVASKGDVPRPNVSSTEEPISPREHCTILLDQLFKNESFRGEFAPILATMLDSSVATVTRCLNESRDLFCKGSK